MTLIEHPTTVAERIVNEVIADIYGRRGGGQWLDSIEQDVLHDEIAPELTAVVQRVLDIEAGAPK